ncbi:MAG: hypothetical protein AAF529_04500 [Pseudomonadota bacterium]
MRYHSKLLVLTALLSLTAMSQLHADVITCHFTEPYITVQHDTAQATVEVSGLGLDTETFTGVGLTLTGVNRLTLSWADKRLDLSMDYEGSDQMSDQIYPMSARLGQSGGSATRHGGCASSMLKRIIPEIFD